MAWRAAQQLFPSIHLQGDLGDPMFHECHQSHRVFLESHHLSRCTSTLPHTAVHTSPSLSKPFDTAHLGIERLNSALEVGGKPRPLHPSVHSGQLLAEHIRAPGIFV